MNKYVKYIGGSLIAATILGVGYNKVFIPKHTFEVISPTKGNLAISITGMGNLDAINIYNITAQTGGKITSLLVDDGDYIKKGELLLTVDSSDLEIQLEIADTNVKKSLLEKDALNNELVNLQAKLELASKTFNRISKLASNDYSSKAELDNATSSLKSLQATVSGTYSRIKSATLSIKVAQENKNTIIEKIAKTKIYAPVDGKVIAKYAEKAQFINPNNIILKIVDPKTLVVSAKFDERISSNIRKGQLSTIKLRSDFNNAIEGKVERISSMSDKVTLEREIKISFSIIPKRFFINEQAQITISIDNLSNVVKIPNTVITNYNGDMGVWVNSRNKAHFKIIEKLAQNNSETAVSNISLNELIIIKDDKKKQLKEGMGIYK